MKSIILVALIAFVAQASLLDTADYTEGFNQQLDLGTDVDVSGQQCFTSLNQTIQNVQSLIRAFHYGADDVAGAVLNLIATADGPLKQNCQDYANDLLSYIAETTQVTNTQTLEYLIQRNAKQYTAQLVQQVSYWIDALVNDDEYEAGTTEAYIVQILIGAKTPAQLNYPVYNFSDYTPSNITQNLLETNQALFSELGFDGEAVAESVLQCYNNYSIASPAINTFINNLKQAQTIVAKVEVVRNSFDDLSFLVESCAPVLWENLEVYIPVVQAIRANPVRTILTIAHNVASHLPELEQSQINASYDLFVHNYTGAGLEQASQIQTAFAGAGY